MTPAPNATDSMTDAPIWSRATQAAQRARGELF